MSGNGTTRNLWWAAWMALALGLFAGNTQAASAIQLWDRQTVYVPVYSHIYYGDKQGSINLTTTLSVRNTDPARPITLLAVSYHDSNGKLVRNYLDKPLELGPLAATYFLVKESDASGGDTPCFLVKWKSAAKVNAPLIEGVMIGTASTQGISFVLPGQVIAE
jgi:hypothetical protein